MTYTYQAEGSASALADVPAGTWFDTNTQTSTQANHEYIMLINEVDFERHISLIDGTKFKVERAGLYNFQFSAQFNNTDGGGNAAAVEVYIKKNGTAVANSGGKISITTNNREAIASWNYFLQLGATDYIQLAWVTTNAGINLVANSLITPGPAIPSLIVTMHQVA